MRCCRAAERLRVSKLQHWGAIVMTRTSCQQAVHICPIIGGAATYGRFSCILQANWGGVLIMEPFLADIRVNHGTFSSGYSCSPTRHSDRGMRWGLPSFHLPSMSAIPVLFLSNAKFPGLVPIGGPCDWRLRQRRRQ